MANRNRLEDLGRIYVLSEQLSKHPIFAHDNIWMPPKHSCDKFDELSEEEQERLIHEMAYALDHLHEKILDIMLIASARDDLNFEDNLGELRGD